jgi:hypothetical protein
LNRAGEVSLARARFAAQISSDPADQYDGGNFVCLNA